MLDVLNVSVSSHSFIDVLLHRFLSNKLYFPASHAQSVG